MDLICPYKVQAVDGKVHGIQALSMIDPTMSWFKIIEVNKKLSETISLKVDQESFNRYPFPMSVTFDQGCEFIGKEFQSLVMPYRVNPQPSMVCNPHSNGAVE